MEVEEDQWMFFLINIICKAIYKFLSEGVGDYIKLEIGTQVINIGMKIFFFFLIYKFSIDNYLF